MDPALVEPHPHRALEAFRRGEFDGLEIIGRADGKALIELCFRARLLEALAEPMPAAGKGPAARRVFAEKAAGLRCSSLYSDTCLGLPWNAAFTLLPRSLGSVRFGPKGCP
ncbi:MAG: hypothetical protein HY674_12025 [Chloroflexi bacterium]|nr:hypothetical protein [Chloroflexota bacterium]